MKMSKMWYCIIIGAVSISAHAADAGAAKRKPVPMPEMPEGPYTPDWESISQHPRCPEWFSDAKFGIYTCWTPLTVPESENNAVGYATYMYREGHRVFNLHKKKYGDQKEFGFKDFVPMFTGKNFDAEEWGDIVASSGAKFAGPLAIHHENFAMWDSKITPWNTKNMGPKVDVTGELAKAYKKRGLKFITTFHHCWTWGYYIEAQLFDGANPDTWDLYGEPREIAYNEKGQPRNAGFPTKRYLDQWLGKVNEVVTQYAPDMIWFDIGFDGRECITPEYQKRVFADYYNWATANGKEVLVGHKEAALLPYSGIKDFERGRSPYLVEETWMTDATMGRSWFYQPRFDGKWHDANWLVDMLMDIVSKNGALLLNIPIPVDGTIPEEGAVELKKMGDWLKINADAVYGTRGWKVFGEPYKELSARLGRGDSEKKVVYTEEDVRFTRSKDWKKVNAIVLGWPKGELTLKYVKVDQAGKDAEITLLGSKEKVGFRINDKQQLVIIPPAKKPHDYAYAFQMTGFELSAHPDAHKDSYMKREDGGGGFSNVAE